VELREEEEKTRLDHSQQISELANTLHLYKIENEKVVGKKDSEIAALNMKVEELTVESQPAVDVDRLKSELLQVKDERTTLQDELDEERLMNSHLKEELSSLKVSLANPTSGHSEEPTFKVPQTPKYSCQLVGSQPVGRTASVDGALRTLLGKENSSNSKQRMPLVEGNEVSHYKHLDDSLLFLDDGSIAVLCTGSN
jgi:DNA gyrase/topoisomerase IV subunit A